MTKNNKYLLDWQEVSDYFICIYNRDYESITYFKLQCLMYLCQSYYLAIYFEPLFKGDFKAGVHAPELVGLFDKYLSNEDTKWTYIKQPNLDDARLQELDNKIKKINLKDFFIDFRVNYLDCSQNELMEYCKKGNPIETPYLVARRGLHPSEKCDINISEDDMAGYYSYHLTGNDLYQELIDTKKELSNLKKKLITKSEDNVLMTSWVCQLCGKCNNILKMSCDCFTKKEDTGYYKFC